MLSHKDKTLFSVAAILLVSFLLGGCSSPLKYEPRDTKSKAVKNTSKTTDGNSKLCRTPYVVKRGDTLSEIAYRCNVDMKALAKRNDLLPPYIIYIKQELMLPVQKVSKVQIADKDVAQNKKVVKEQISKQEVKPATKADNQKVVQNKQQKSLPVTKTATARALEKSEKVKSPSKKVSTASKKWQWPMHKGLAYKYRRDNAGLSVLEIYGVPGQKVHAVAPGKVVYAGNGILNYGWMLVIKHANDYMSIYAHNSALMVKEGDQVNTGQQVATMGATGNTNRPKLYVEARYQGRKTDIKKVLKR